MALLCVRDQMSDFSVDSSKMETKRCIGTWVGGACFL